METLRPDELFWTIFNSPSLGFIVATPPDARILHANARFCEMLGYSAEEIKKLQIFDLRYPEDSAESEAAYAEMLAGRLGVMEKERLYRRKDGSPIWMGVYASTVTGSDGTAQYHIGLYRDITAEKQSALAAHQSRQQMDALLSNFSGFLWAVDLKGNVTIAGGHGMEHMGWTAANFTGKNIYEEFAHRPEGLAHLRRAMDGEMVSYHCEIAGRWLETNFSPLRDLQGRITGAVVYCIDISSRHVHEEEVRKWSEIFLRAQWGMSITRPDHTFARVNPAFARMHGLTPEEWVGRSLLEAFPESFRPKYPAIYEELCLKGKVTFESPHLRADGTEFPVLTESSAIYDESGKLLYRISNFVDLTELRKMEFERTRLLEEQQKLAVREQAALETSRLKSEFLANMSHEIRTPINGVLGMLNLLANTELSPDQRRYVNSITSSSKLLLHLVNDILDLSKVEAGHLDIESTPFDLQILAEEAKASFEPLASAKNLRFSYSFRSDSPSPLQGDPSRIRQILNNLLSNAIKFTKEGRIFLSVAHEAIEHGSALVSIAVSDTGIGMSPEFKERIFQKFVQADSSTSRKFGGSGLGLAISKKLAELMGGTITASSTLGKGTTFEFRVKLPRIKQTQASTDPNAFPASLSRETRGRIRILVVEDNLINAEIVLHMLARAGYSAHIASNGHNALQRISEEHFDLILMDCHMPELDGFVTSQLLRTLGYRRPIIALTANAFTEAKARCRAAGMSDHLAKPFLEEDLIQLIDRWAKKEKIPARSPAAPVDESELAIDREAIKKLEELEADGQNGLISNLVALFAETSRDSIAQLLTAQECGDTDSLRKQAHRLKSSSAFLGALKVSRTCELLEYGDLSQGEKVQLLENLGTELEKARKALGELETVLPGVQRALLPRN